MPEEMLRVDGLRLERGGRTVLPAVDWTIPGPGLYAITGPSGSGKSSLLLAIAGLIAPSAGCIRFAAPPRRGELAMVWQDLHLIGRDSVLANAACGSLHRLRWWQSLLRFPRQVRERARAELAELGIAHLHRRWARDVSGGERARCAIARALVQDARVLLADEPVAALDGVTAEQVMRRLRRHAEAGNLVICALHQPELIARHAQGVLTLGADQAQP